MYRIMLLCLVAILGLVSLPLTAPSAAMQDAAPACSQNAVPERNATGWRRCTCSAEATQTGEVWGYDVYAEESSLCRAALHAGDVRSSGGDIVFQIRPARNGYDGTTRNGVTSRSRGSSAASFAFSPNRLQAQANQAAQNRQAASRQQARASTAACPDDGRGLRIGDNAICQCYADQIGRGAVYGTTYYAGDSSICRAALHFGAVFREGGMIHYEAVRGRERYDADPSNGVESEAAEGDSVAVVFATRRCPPTGEGLPAPTFCSCNSHDVLQGEARGSGAYRSTSSICAAALAERKVGRDGGVVAVYPYSGTTTYNTSRTVNGETVNDSGTFRGGFEFRDLDDLER